MLFYDLTGGGGRKNVLLGKLFQYYCNTWAKIKFFIKALTTRKYFISIYTMKGIFIKSVPFCAQGVPFYAILFRFVSLLDILKMNFVIIILIFKIKIVYPMVRLYINKGWKLYFF